MKHSRFEIPNSQTVNAPCEPNKGKVVRLFNYLQILKRTEVSNIHE